MEKIKNMKHLIAFLFVGLLLWGCKKDATTYVTFINTSPNKDLSYVVSHKGKVVFESQLPAGENELMEVPVGDIKIEVSGDGYNKVLEDTITKEDVDKKSLFGSFIMDLYDKNVLYVINGNWFYEGHDDEEIKEDIIENPTSIFELDGDMIYYPYSNLNLPDSVDEGTSIEILVPVSKDLYYNATNDSIKNFLIDYISYYMPDLQ